jgi:hypothetical protein
VLPLTLHPFPMHDKRRRFLRTVACSEMTCEGGNLLQGLNFRGLFCLTTVGACVIPGRGRSMPDA